MNEVHVGHLEKMHNFSLSPIAEYISWRDGEPHDGSVKEVVDPIHISLTALFSFLGICGIVFAVVCLLFNFFLRERIIMKLSSPKLNYVIGCGAILLYISIILVVIPLEEENRDLASTLCYTTPWFTAVGYSLCYGTILVKMFRTWYIFNKPMANKKQVHDWMLLLIVLCLVVIDIVILSVYTGLEVNGEGATRVVNREQEVTVTGPQEVVTEHYVYVCNSMERRVTLGILYGYKGVLQVLALLLSFATWKVQIKGLDDSKPIIIATYVTSLVLAVVIVSTYSLVEFVNAYATVFDFGFFIGTTLILCLVFMTKMYMLYIDPEGKSVFMTKSGEMRDNVRSGSSLHGSQTAPEGSLKRINTDLNTNGQ